MKNKIIIKRTISDLDPRYLEVESKTKEIPPCKKEDVKVFALEPESTSCSCFKEDENLCCGRTVTATIEEGFILLRKKECNSGQEDISEIKIEIEKLHEFFETCGYTIVDN